MPKTTNSVGNGIERICFCRVPPHPGVVTVSVATLRQIKNLDRYIYVGDCVVPDVVSSISLTGRSGSKKESFQRNESFMSTSLDEFEVAKEACSI
jgi:hypothetical protein